MFKRKLKASANLLLVGFLNSPLPNVLGVSMPFYKKYKSIKEIFLRFPFNLWMLVPVILIGIRLNKAALPKKYYLSVCAIFKNESRYLEEWIEFHRLVGVEHFYLYNNFSSDNYIEVLKPYIENNIVTLIDWPVKHGQYPAYRDCLQNQADTKWLAYIDCDEFIIPNSKSSLPYILKQYKNFPAYSAHWKVFGSGGNFIDDKTKLVTEKFFVAENTINSCVKTIINTSWKNYLHIYDAHICHAKVPFIKRIFPIMEDYSTCRQHRNIKLSRHKKMVVHHYWCKSYDEFVTKKIPNGLADVDGVRVLKDMWDLDLKSSMPDFNAYRFLTRLKLSMQNKAT